MRTRNSDGEFSWSPPVKLTLDKVTVFDAPVPLPGIAHVAHVLTIPADVLPSVRQAKSDGVRLSVLHTGLQQMKVCAGMMTHGQK